MLGVVFIVCLVSLAGCARAGVSGSTAECRDLARAAEAFYQANDDSRFDDSLALLTQDVVKVRWAEGANGHHMAANFTVGKDQILDHLSTEGLTRTARNAERPNFEVDELQVEGQTVAFILWPDRARPDGRPFNHYVVKLVFSGCQIELIKVVERVTWL
jgi:hypothetical protein